MPEQQLYINPVKYIATAIGILFIVFVSVAVVSSQEENPDAAVSLKLEKNVFRNSEVVKAKISVRNDGKEAIYLVIPPKLMFSYNVEKRALGLGLEFHPASEHAFEMPPLRKLLPGKTTTLLYSVVFSSWPLTEGGHWLLDSSVGIIRSDRLREKLGEEPGAADIPAFMSREAFLEIQELSYSPSIQVEIR